MKPSIRARVLSDLRARRALTIKAICERYKISRSTVARLQRELAQKSSFSQLTR